MELGCNEDRSAYIAAGGLFVCPSGGCAPLPELAHLGIETVLDLRGAMIHKPREGKLVQAAGMQYVGIRLSGIFPPKPN